jgi:hypothetical protein
MFELDGTQFEKGQFEIRLKKKSAGLLRPLFALGPVHGRFIVLGILLVAAFATIQRQPAGLFINHAWVNGPEQAEILQKYFSWGMCLLAVFIWALLMLFREESLVLNFDKGKSELRTWHIPLLRQKLEQKGIYPFKDIVELKVFAKGNEVSAPHGYLKLRAKDNEGTEKSFKFKFLTDEQFSFFPLNLYRITQLLPTGDWKDPEDLIS